MGKTLLLIFSLVSFTLLAQNQDNKTLIQQLQNADNDTVRAKIFIQLAQLSLHTQGQKETRSYLDTAILLTKEKHKYLYAKALEISGNLYDSEGLPEKAIHDLKEAGEIFTELNKTPDYIQILVKMGGVYLYTGNYSEVLHYTFEALQLAEQEENKSLIAVSMKNIGMAYDLQGDANKSLEYYSKSLSIYYDLGDKSGIVKNLINIGVSYANSGKQYKALDYYFDAIEMLKKMEKPLLLASCYLQIGSLYLKVPDTKTAIGYFEESISIFKLTNYRLGVAMAFKKIGDTYTTHELYDSALVFYAKSYAIARNIKANKESKEACLALSGSYSKLHRYDSAYHYLRLAENLQEKLLYKQKTKQIEQFEKKYRGKKQNALILEEQKNMNLLMAISLIAVGIIILLIVTYIRRKKTNRDLKTYNENIRELNFQKDNQTEEMLAQTEQLALINMELAKLSLIASKAKNSVMIINISGEIEWVNKSFERMFGYTLDDFLISTGTKINKIELRPNIQNAINQVIKTKKSIIYTSESTHKNGQPVWFQTTLTPILNSRQEIERFIAIDTNITGLKQAETKIKQQYAEIEKQRDKINFQNEEITDSILYARYIQNAALPQKNFINQLFKKYFVINEPKHIVSGDFYWVAHRYNKTIIAIADCTGHGVPGALLAMLGITFLVEAIDKASSIEAAVILDLVRQYFIRTLSHQAAAKNYDGIDMAICIVDKAKKKLNYSSTNIPMYLLKSHKIIELTGDKITIDLQMINNKKFTNYTFDYQPDSMIYLATNGFASQFGGEQNRKFSTRQLKDLLLEIHRLEVAEQAEIIYQNFIAWKGDLKQTDDMLFLGVRL